MFNTLVYLNRRVFVMDLCIYDYQSNHNGLTILKDKKKKTLWVILCRIPVEGEKGIEELALKRKARNRGG